MIRMNIRRGAAGQSAARRYDKPGHRHRSPLPGLLFAVLFCLGGPAPPVAACDPAALSPLAAGEKPLLLDDLCLRDLPQSVAGSVAALAGIDPARQFALCGGTYTGEWLRKSMDAFSQAIGQADNEAELQSYLFEHFTLCRAAGGDGAGRMLVTGYYEPEFAGSLVREAPFLHPLYGVPPDLVTEGEKAGRLQDGRLLPYWSRGEIEAGDLLHGQEIVYLSDPIDVFILHVQGSGRIRLPDGEVRQVQFAATNGREYRSIGRLLADRGVMALEEVTMPKIVAYLRDHPGEMREIFDHNERYVFFSLSAADKKLQDAGPAGSLGQPLTAGRSLAVDSDCFPVPLPGYLETELPVFDEQGNVTGWQTLHRFVVNQDTGAAIRGPGRADLFLGADAYAARAAGVMKQAGALYFLILKARRQ
jgi:membrane-bound lytic murein transglycosylase A